MKPPGLGAGIPRPWRTVRAGTGPGKGTEDRNLTSCVDGGIVAEESVVGVVSVCKTVTTAVVKRCKES